MKRYPGIDYKQRPASYWTEEHPLTAILRNVKGRERRAMIRSYWEQGRLGELDETLLRDTLSEEDRDRLGQIHPVFMGGEYLPEYDDDEVEIARLDLESTTADVISIRARRLGRRIRYRIVDEYNGEFRLEREESTRPLSLAGLIRFLDGSSHPDLSEGLVLGYNAMNVDCSGDSRAAYRHFTRISSDIYPELSHHYAYVLDEWVAEEEKEAEQEEQA